MKSAIKKDTYKAIYRLLDRVSPVCGDCGNLCQSICCTCDENAHNEEDEPELGIYLLPGEEKLFTGNEDWLHWSCNRAEDYEFPDSWHGKVYFLKCKTPPFCQRAMRPMQCRIFPIAPHIDQNKVLHIIYNCDSLPYSCPLITEKMQLNVDFLRANYTVWKRLIQDSLIFDLVEMDSICRIEDGKEITFLYP